MPPVNTTPPSGDLNSWLPDDHPALTNAGAGQSAVPFHDTGLASRARQFLTNLDTSMESGTAKDVQGIREHLGYLPAMALGAGQVAGKDIAEIGTSLGRGAISGMEAFKDWGNNPVAKQWVKQGAPDPETEGAIMGAAGVRGLAPLPTLPKVSLGGDAIGRAVEAITRPFTEGGQEKIAGKFLGQAATGTPEFAQAPLPGMKLTTGQATNDPGLIWLERAAGSASPAAATASAEATTANNAAIRSGIGQIGDLNQTNASEVMRDRLAANVDPHGAAQRVGSDLSNTLGVAPNANVYAIKDQLEAARKQAARPLYDAYENYHPLNPEAMDQNGSIGQFMSRPSVKHGMANALKMAAEQGVDPSTLGIVFNEAGDPILSQTPTWKTLDYIKGGIDDVVENYRDPVTGKLNLDRYGDAANKTRFAFRDAIDQLNPYYAPARAEWAGPSQSIDATWAGRNIFRPDTELTQKRIASLPNSDLPFFRAGVVRAVQDLMGTSSDGIAAVQRVFSQPGMRQKISAAFPPNTYDQFISRVDSEMSGDPILAKVLSTNPDGSYKFPASAVADQFIRSGSGAPEAFQTYMKAAGHDPTALDAARSAFAQKFMDAIQNKTLGPDGEPVLSAAKLPSFLNDYDHVVNSRLFTQDQKDLIQNVRDASEMASRTDRARPTAGGSDTSSKIAAGVYGKTYLDSLLGKRVARVATTAAGAAAGYVSGVPGGTAIGALTGATAGNEVIQMLYGASRDKVAAILTRAMHDPELAKSLMAKPSVGAEKTMNPNSRAFLLGVLRDNQDQVNGFQGP